MVPRKMAELAFRWWWLVVLPPVAAAIAVAALVKHPVKYESTATVWVSETQGVRAAAFGQAQKADQTASEAFVAVAQDLLHTMAFRESVAVTAGFVRASDPQDVRESTAVVVGSRISVYSLGPNVAGIRAEGPVADGTTRLVDAMIVEYQRRAQEEGDREAQTVVSYFERQTAAAEAELAKDQAELASYLKSHPAAADRTKLDADLAALQGEVDSQARIAERLRGSLEDARLTAASTSNSLSATFSVQDAPSRPVQPMTAARSRKLAYPAAAGVLALLACLSFVYARYRMDHAVRSGEDLAGLGVPLLGSVPMLKRPRPHLIVRLLLPWKMIRRRHRNFARQLAVSIPPLQKEEPA